MYTPGNGGAYAPAGWGQPSTGGGGQHAFFTPGGTNTQPSVSAGWGASTTTAPVDPQAQAAAEAADMTRFLQSLGGVTGRSHAAIHENLSRAGYTDLWLLRSATIEQLVATGVRQAHANYIWAALHQDTMPDIKIWPKFPVVAEGWPSEQAVLRFYKEVGGLQN